MNTKIRYNPLIKIKTWRSLVNIWTLLLYFFILADYFKMNGLVEILGPICAIYVAVLSIYSAQKEFERWRDHHKGKHPGETYVIVWTMLIIVLIILEIIPNTNYRLPSEVFTTYIVVLGVLAITKRSKSTYCNQLQGK